MVVNVNRGHVHVQRDGGSNARVCCYAHAGLIRKMWCGVLRIGIYRAGAASGTAVIARLFWGMQLERFCPKYDLSSQDGGGAKIRFIHWILRTLAGFHFMD